MRMNKYILYCDLEPVQIPVLCTSRKFPDKKLCAQQDWLCAGSGIGYFVKQSS